VSPLHVWQEESQWHSCQSGDNAPTQKLRLPKLHRKDATKQTGKWCCRSRSAPSTHVAPPFGRSKGSLPYAPRPMQLDMTRTRRKPKPLDLTAALRYGLLTWLPRKLHISNTMRISSVEAGSHARHLRFRIKTYAYTIKGDYQHNHPNIL
jgi:hypothetical protein